MNRRIMQHVPSDFMSFSTFYNKEYAGNKKRAGARKMNCFALMNFIAGRNMTSIFEIKGYKKDLV